MSSSGALFGSAAARGGGHNNLVELKAGKMTINAETQLVTPDKRKGLIYVHQSEDSLVHFCWKERRDGSKADDDLIIFPDDAEFKLVKSAKTGSRVYVLKFKTTERKLFFWLQEPKADTDDDLVKKVNESLNSPPAPGSNRGGSGSGAAGSARGSGGIQALSNLLGGADMDSWGPENDYMLQSMLGMDRSQMMQILGHLGQAPPGSGASQASGTPPTTPAAAVTTTAAATPTTQPTAATPTSAAGAVTTTTTTTKVKQVTRTTTTPQPASIQLSDLQNILQSMNVPTPAPAGPPVDLAQGLTPEMMNPILENPAVQDALRPYLPADLNVDPNELHATVSSPQFQQAMSAFSSALQSGQLGPLMSEFGLGEDVVSAAAAGDVEKFLAAMQAANATKSPAPEEKKEQEGEKKDEPKKKPDEDEDMALD